MGENGGNAVDPPIIRSKHNMCISAISHLLDRWLKINHKQAKFICQKSISCKTVSTDESSTCSKTSIQVRMSTGLEGLFLYFLTAGSYPWTEIELGSCSHKRDTSEPLRYHNQQQNYKFHFHAFS